MTPKYPVGSLVYVQPTAPSDVQVGDAISFHFADDLVATHEVRENNQTDQYFRTQGINNRDENGDIIPDAAPVFYNQVIGKVVFSLPFLGFVYQHIKANLVVYFALAIIITFMLKLVSEKVKHNDVEGQNDK